MEGESVPQRQPMTIGPSVARLCDPWCVFRFRAPCRLNRADILYLVNPIADSRDTKSWQFRECYPIPGLEPSTLAPRPKNPEPHGPELLNLERNESIDAL